MLGMAPEIFGRYFLRVLLGFLSAPQPPWYGGGRVVSGPGKTLFVCISNKQILPPTQNDTCRKARGLFFCSLGATIRAAKGLLEGTAEPQRRPVVRLNRQRLVSALVSYRPKFALLKLTGNGVLSGKSVLRRGQQCPPNDT